MASKRNTNKKLHQRRRQQERRDRERRARTRGRPPDAPRLIRRPPLLAPEESEYILTIIDEAEVGRPKTTVAQLRKLVRRLPFETAALNVARLQCRLEPVLTDPAGHWRLAQEFFTGQPELLAAFQARLTGQTTRTIFSPQALTFLMRVLIEDALDEPVRDLETTERRWLQDAVLGAHSAHEPALQNLPRPPDEEKLAYELQAATFFHRPSELEEMARHRELIRLGTSDDRLMTSPNRVPLTEWLSASGLSPAEQWALGFGVGAIADAFGDEVQPQLSEEQVKDLLAKVGLDRYSTSVPIISSSRAEFRERFHAFGGGVSSFGWEQRPFKSTPFLRLGNGDLVLLSPPWLLSWLGEGFHYRALTHAQSQSTNASAKYTRFAGEVTERYALDLAEAAAPSSVAVMGEQRYGSGGGQRTSDVAILFGRDLLVFEIHARRVGGTAAVTGGAAEATLEVSRLLVGKIDQLGVAIGALVSEDASLPGVEMTKVDRIWPIVVSASYVRQSPRLWKYLRSAMDAEKTASLRDPPVRPLQVLDIEAYERLMGLMEAGEDVPNLLARKTASEYRDRDLAVWLNEDASAPAETPRMTLLAERWDAMADEVQEMARRVEASKSAED